MVAMRQMRKSMRDLEDVSGVQEKNSSSHTMRAIRMVGRGGRKCSTRGCEWKARPEPIASLYAAYASFRIE